MPEVIYVDTAREAIDQLAASYEKRSNELFRRSEAMEADVKHKRLGDIVRTRQEALTYMLEAQRLRDMYVESKANNPFVHSKPLSEILKEEDWKTKYKSIDVV